MLNIKRFNRADTKYEYGLDGIRSFPWCDHRPAIGSGYCVVRPNSSTLEHVNSPDDEAELFVGVMGLAKVVLDDEEFEIGQGDQVYIPQGVKHYIKNDNDQEFHFFTVWWNKQTASDYLESVHAKKNV